MIQNLRNVTRPLWIAIVALAVLGGMASFAGYAGWVFWAPAIALAICAAAMPQATSRLLKRAGIGYRSLRQAVSSLAIGLLFFGVFTPLSVAVRLLGRSQRRRGAPPTSYWIDRRRSPLRGRSATE